MPTPAEATAAGHDASFSVAEVEPVVAPFKVEGADGWTVGSTSAGALAELVAEKLRQAEQNRADAEQAITHWTAVSEAVEAHR